MREIGSNESASRIDTRRPFNLSSGRRWGAATGSLIAESYAVAVAGSRRRRGEAGAPAGEEAATGGRGGSDWSETRLGRAGEAAATGGKG